MENLIRTLAKKQTSYGHFNVSIEKDGETLDIITTNTMAIDVAFDNNYDDADNSERYYSSQREAQEELVTMILIRYDKWCKIN